MPTAILLKDVDNLGERGTVVDVSKGYLRNFLIPRNLAQPATPASIEAARRAQEAAERAAAQAAERAREQADTLTKTVLTIPSQAGPDGRLYGSVTTSEIADAIRDARGLRSTSARSSSTSRSATSAPTWCRSSSPRAPRPT